MFLCRSGVRSHHAAAIAAMQAGYSKAYNVLQGFEGDKDRTGSATSWADGAPPVCPGRRANTRRLELAASNRFRHAGRLAWHAELRATAGVRTVRRPEQPESSGSD